MSFILTIQGWFYILTGVWPLLHMRSFEMVSGPKKDKWLVQTLGLMITASGIIFVSYPESEVSYCLAFMNAVFLASIDFYFVLKRVIWKTYLIDGFIEVGFVTLLVLKKTDILSLLDL